MSKAFPGPEWGLPPRHAHVGTPAGPHRPRLPLPHTASEAVEAVERRLIASALEREGGNRTRAAKRLGLSRQGLLNKMERYGLG